MAEISELFLYDWLVAPVKVLVSGVICIALVCFVANVIFWLEEGHFWNCDPFLVWDISRSIEHSGSLALLAETDLDNARQDKVPTIAQKASRLDSLARVAVSDLFRFNLGVFMWFVGSYEASSPYFDSDSYRSAWNRPDIHQKYARLQDGRFKKIEVSRLDDLERRAKRYRADFRTIEIQEMMSESNVLTVKQMLGW